MKKERSTNTRFKWNSAKTKLIAGMVAVALVPMIAITLISNVITKNDLTAEVSQSTKQATIQASKSLDYKMQGVANQLSLLSHNINFTEFYQNPNNATYGFFLLEGTQKTSKEYSNVYFASSKKEMILAPKQELPAGYDPTGRDWYKGAIAKDGAVYYSPAYQDAISKQIIITVAQAVKDKNGASVGVAAIDLDVTSFSNELKDIKIGKNGYMTVIGPDGNYIAHPDKSLLGESAKDLALWKDVSQKTEGYSEYTFKGSDKFSAFTTNQKTGWKFVSTLEKSEITSGANHIKTMGWILTAIFALISALVAYLIGKSISNNINSVKGALEAASAGDFTGRVSVKTNDEFKELEQSFNHTMEELTSSLQTVEGTSKAVLETSANLSNMTRETTAALSEVALAIGEIAQGANLQAKNINVSSGQMRALSEQLDEISHATNDMNNASKLSMELSNKGLTQVELLTDKSAETKTSTTEVATIVNEVDVRMEEINAIIEVIAKITDQTNLLSLNASIESARAGEHGRGFAVVANEVRNLAEQSKASAVEIKRIVESIKSVVKKAVQAMEQTNQAVSAQDVAVTETRAIFTDILSAIHNLAEKVEEVQGTIRQSQSNKEAVSQEMDSISSVSEQTAAATDEVSASAEQISATMQSFTIHANGLKELSEQLENELKKFKL
ncbi:methyl-accepting chemotaxis protein [Bacillus sp. ISL-18]|nr:methyl-accepting chemotaxis protein [Bacillus sp. ISL-18]MBT2657814.1 methyl-accepting chemotaxis protein [Bacillus sp. ISL-18]